MPHNLTSTVADDATACPPVIQHYMTTNMGCAAYLIAMQMRYAGVRPSRRINRAEFIFHDDADGTCIALARQYYVSSALIEARVLLTSMAFLKNELRMFAERKSVAVNGNR
jgi:hypothetical protein